MEIKNTARFYFANLIADVVRCIKAATEHNDSRYTDSLARAHMTLNQLHTAHRPEAYKEGLLLMRGLALSFDDGTLPAFKRNLDVFTAPLVLL